MTPAQKGKPLTILAVFLLLTTLTATMAIATNAAATITVATDKASYTPGATLGVSGKISPVDAGQEVAILVNGPTGDLKSVAQIKPSADGSYSQTVLTFAPTDATGTWTVKATYEGVSAQTSFTYTGVPPRTNIAVNVWVSTGRVYFTNETADIYVLTAYNGMPLDANVTTMLYTGGSSSKLTLSKVSSGLYMVNYKPAADAKAGTYTVVADATILTAQYSGKGIGISSFELTQAMSAINTAVNSVKSSIAVVKTDTGSILGKFPIAIDLTPMWVAVVLSLVAAIAAIYSTITVQRKIAG